MDSKVQLSRVSWPEHLFLVQTSLLLVVMGFSIRCWGLATCHGAVKRWATTLSRVTYTSRDRDERARRLAHLVDKANQRYLLFPMSCLTKSLVLLWILRRHGVPSELRLGVRNITGRLEAHAWVEIDGTALSESDDVTQIYADFDLT